MKKQITVAFDFGDRVILKTDNEFERIVTGIVLRPNGKMYELASGVETSWHQECEIDRVPEKTVVGGFGKPTKK